MKKLGAIVVVLICAGAMVAGCSSGEMSKQEEAKLKSGLEKGGDINAMTPEQKKQFEEHMKGMQTPQSAPPR